MRPEVATGKSHFRPEDELLEMAARLKGKRVSATRLYDFCVEAMTRAGWREQDVRITAEVLVTADTMGVHTHGTKQLKSLLEYHRSGSMDVTVVPQLLSEGPSWAIVDGKDAVPMAAAATGMELAIKKATTTGIAYVGVKQSSHFGPAGYYANMAAEQGMIGISMCNVDPGVTAPGARGKVLGTNPIAYAVPAGDEPTILLDIATSAVAASKIFAYRATGKPLPDNWLVDDHGLPTTDPSEYPERGALQPMAGHKGYGLALLVEVLSAALTGAAMMGQAKSWVDEKPEPTGQGFAFVAINPAVIMGSALFEERMDWMIRSVKQAPTAKGSDRIYLPGGMEWERRDEALAIGMLLPEDVLASLAGLAQDTGLDLKVLFD